MRPRSNSLGAIVLPLDTADSIRNVCVNTSCGNDLVTSKVSTLRGHAPHVRVDLVASSAGTV